jgi:hypothetical protein
MECDNFNRLTQKQIFSIVSRFNYIDEIIENINEWLDSDKTELSHFIDDLELDLSVNQNLPGDEGKESSYLIHNSWTFNMSPSSLRSELSETIIKSINEEIPGTMCSLDDFKLWIQNQSLALNEAVTGFYSAKSSPSAIAFYIAIDIILINLLSSTYKMRLNDELTKPRTHNQ